MQICMEYSNRQVRRSAVSRSRQSTTGDKTDDAVPNPNQKPFTRFEYKYSGNYNQHRLTPEEAEALRKKLREENQNVE